MPRSLSIFGPDERLVVSIPLTQKQYEQLNAAMKPGRGEFSHGEGMQPDPDRILSYDLAAEGMTIFLEPFA